MYPYNFDSTNDNDDHRVYEEMQTPEGRQYDSPLYDNPFYQEPENKFGPNYKPGTRPDYNPGYNPRPDYGPGPKPGPDYGPGPKPGSDYGPGPKPGPGKFPYDDNQYQPPNVRPDNAKPTGPPPKYTPKETANLYAVDPRTIRGCLYSNTYVWLENGNSFWMYPTTVGRNSISGYRWTRYGWVYFGMDLDIIQSFYCVPY